MPSPKLNVIKNDVKDIKDDTSETLRRYTVGALPPTKSPRTESKVDEWDLKLYGKQSKSNIELFGSV